MDIICMCPVRSHLFPVLRTHVVNLFRHSFLHCILYYLVCVLSSKLLAIFNLAIQRQIRQIKSLTKVSCYNMVINTSS